MMDALNCTEHNDALRSNKRILLVEDQAVVAMLETKQLRDYGYDVYHVENGEDAIAAVLEDRKGFDLILMDIDLGTDMAGTAAAGEILKHTNIPIIFLSSHTKQNVVEKTEELASYGYVVKNSGIFVLHASIKMAFRLFEAHQRIEREAAERKRAEEAVKRQLSEKETLLKEVHHRIKNNMESIRSLLKLQIENAVSHEVQSALREAAGQVESMSAIYDKLLASGDYAETSAKTYLEDLISAVAALHAENSHIDIFMDIVDCQLDVKKLFPLGSIVNELMTNSMKYAFNDMSSGAIHISLSSEGSRFTLTVQDNGRGLPEDSATSSGFGMMLVDMLTQQLGGTCSFENSSGTKCTVVFGV